MNDLSSGQRLRVLLLFSDTGGGHRSAAEALIEAWETEHPGRVQVEMVDVFRSYTPFPFNLFGPSYPWLVKYCCRGYGTVYRCSDTPRRAQVLARVCYGYVHPISAGYWPSIPPMSWSPSTRCSIIASTGRWANETCTCPTSPS